MFRSLFRNRKKHPARRSFREFKPALLTLEGRVVPSTVRWIVPASGDWAVATNWSTGTVPGAADDVIIDMPGNVTVTHSAGTDSVHSLTSNDSLVVSGGSLALANPTTLNSLTLTGGTLTGTGDITVNGLLQWTGGTLAGTRTGGDHPWIAATSELDISGSAEKFLSSRDLDNRVDGSLSGGPLTMQYAILTNYAGATLRTTNTTIHEATPWTGNVINAGELQVFNGLTLNTTGVTNSGTLAVFSGWSTTAVPTGRFINNGQIRLWDVGVGVDINVESYQQGAVDRDASIIGSGSVRVAASTETSYVWGEVNVGGDASFSGSFIFNFPNFTIGRALSFGNGSLSFGAGSVQARTVAIGGQQLASVELHNTSLSVSLEMTVAPTGNLLSDNATIQTNTFTNAGFGNVYNSQVMTRTVDNEGTLIVAGTSVIATLEGAVNRGHLVGAGGSIAGDLVNAGTIDFGVAGWVGTLTITGNYTQTAQGSMSVKLGGGDPEASSDQLLIGGAAQLDGSLTVSMMSGYTPAEGDNFQFLTANSIAGDFASFFIPTFDEGYYLTPLMDGQTYSFMVQKQA